MNKYVDETSQNGYPSEFVSAKEKLTPKWALAYFKATWAEANKGSEQYVESNTNRIKSLRKKAEGLESVQDIQKLYTQGIDFKNLKLDYSVPTILPKLVKIASRTIYNQPYVPQATPVNSSATTKANIERNKMKAKMDLEKARIQLEQEGVEGAIPEAEGFVPENDEELEYHFLMNPKMGHSVAMEYLIRGAFMKNDMEAISKIVARDFVIAKRGGIKVGFDLDNNLTIDRVDVANFISGYFTKEDGSDSNHMGTVISMPISELRELAGDSLKEEDLIKIAKQNVNSTELEHVFGSNNYYQGAIDVDRYDNVMVKVVNLQVKTFDSFKYLKTKKKDGKGFYYDRRSNDYTVPEGVGNKIVNIGGAEAIYEGYWVVDTDYVFRWDKDRAAYRDRLNGKWSNTAKFGYCMQFPNILDMTSKSIVEQMEYHHKQLKITELKMQQFILNASPPTTEYDVDKLLGAIQGMGMGKMTPLDLVNMKTQLGALFTRSKDEMGQVLTNAPATQKIDSGVDQSILILGELYNSHLYKLKEVIGHNSAVDGSQPDKKALVGVQKMAAEGHKAALDSEASAFLRVIAETAKRVCVGYQTQIRSNENVEEITYMVGEANVKEVKLNDIEGVDFDISIEMLPVAYEEEAISNDLQEMVTAGTLPPEAKYEIMATVKESPKKAKYQVAYMSKKFRQEKEQAAQQNIQLQGQENSRVAQESAALEAQNIQLKSQSDIQNTQAKGEVDKANYIAEADQKIRLAIVEGDIKKELLKLASEEKAKEVDRAEKSDRVNETINEKVSRGGYDVEKDSVPRAAGKIEPSVVPTTPSVSV
jgi:hypothetical protein